MSTFCLFGILSVDILSVRHLSVRHFVCRHSVCTPFGQVGGIWGQVMFAHFILGTVPYSDGLARVVALIMQSYTRLAMSCTTSLIIRPRYKLDSLTFIFMWNCIELRQCSKNTQLSLFYPRLRYVYLGTSIFIPDNGARQLDQRTTPKEPKKKMKRKCTQENDDFRWKKTKE